MKSTLLLLAMVLFGTIPAAASTAGYAVLNGEDFNPNRSRFLQPITFIERGIEFLIFSDGSFDFNTEINPSTFTEDDFYFRNRRRGPNNTFGAPGQGQIDRRGHGVLIIHDHLGRVRRIGNTFLNYDRQGRIKRVGTVYMRYRRGLLTQVGGLRLLYNRRGVLISTRGNVNLNTQNCNPWSSDGNANFHNGFGDANWDTQEDFYYYRNGRYPKALNN